MADAGIRGELLTRLRVEAGLTRAELARHVDVWDSSAVRAWERGAQQPSPSKIPLLAAALGVDPLELFEPVGDPTLGMLRRAAGLTLTQLAARTGMSYARCQRLEKGQLAPTRDGARRLAAAFGVPINGVQAAAAATRNPTTRPGP